MRAFIFLFIPLFSFGQKECSGKIVDALSGTVIPFATIALVKENKGVSANEYGVFSITSLVSGDSLRISSVGYATKYIRAGEWVNGKNVELEPLEKVLREVIITKVPSKTITLNPFRNCSLNWFMISHKVMYQLAQRFEAPKEGLQLRRLQFCKDPSESIFRIRVYDLDSSCQCPSTDLADTIIEVRSKESKVVIDLEEYNIIIPGKSFFIALEWIFIPSNEETQRIKLNGQKTNITWFKPAIRYVNRKNSNSKNIWILHFNGNWQARPSDQVHDFQIKVDMKMFDN